MWACECVCISLCIVCDNRTVLAHLRTPTVLVFGRSMEHEARPTFIMMASGVQLVVRTAMSYALIRCPPRECLRVAGDWSGATREVTRRRAQDGPHVHVRAMDVLVWTRVSKTLFAVAFGSQQCCLILTPFVCHVFTLLICSSCQCV